MKDIEVYRFCNDMKYVLNGTIQDASSEEESKLQGMLQGINMVIDLLENPSVSSDLVDDPVNRYAMLLAFQVPRRNSLMIELEKVVFDACHIIDGYDPEKSVEILKRTMKIMNEFGEINDEGGQE